MKKKMYRKIVAAALAAVMVLSMTGCGDKDETKGASSAGNEPGSSFAGSGTDQGEDTGAHEFSYFGAIWSPYQESTPIFD